MLRVYVKRYPHLYLRLPCTTRSLSVGSTSAVKLDDILPSFGQTRFLDPNEPLPVQERMFRSKAFREKVSLNENATDITYSNNPAKFNLLIQSIHQTFEDSNFLAALGKRDTLRNVHAVKFCCVLLNILKTALHCGFICQESERGVGIVPTVSAILRVTRCLQGRGGLRPSFDEPSKVNLKSRSRFLGLG